MKIENVPNTVTLIRVLLVLPLLACLALQYFQWAFYIFVIAGLSDGIDGYVARRYNCQSLLGAFLDPLFDKLLMIVCLISLHCLQKIPTWFLVLVISRDVIIIGGAIAYFYVTETIKFIPSLVSKANTVLQIALLGLLLFELAYIDLPDWLMQNLIRLVGFTTVVSLANYVWVWGRKSLQGDG